MAPSASIEKEGALKCNEDHFLKEASTKRKLVIIGGGYAGTFTAMHLEHEFETILIDSKPYFEFTPSKLRTLVEPSKASVVQLNYSTFLEKTDIICGNVTHVSTDFVFCEDGQTFNYDFLVISR
jgi:NADH dehydrogenase FAD-containing subunit